MKLINPSKKELICQQSWAIAIKNRFGDAQSFIMKLNPDVQEYCSENLPKLCADETIPSLVRLAKVYNNKTAEAFLNVHLTDAIVAMGESSISHEEIKLIARTIRADDKLRTLNVAMIMHFFKKLKGGQFKIFGACTPRKVLECMQTFYSEAIEMQCRYHDDNEKAKRALELKAHQEEAICFSEYAKRKNLDRQSIENFGYGLLGDWVKQSK